MSIQSKARVVDLTKEEVVIENPGSDKDTYTFTYSIEKANIFITRASDGKTYLAGAGTGFSIVIVKGSRLIYNTLLAIPGTFNAKFRTVSCNLADSEHSGMTEIDYNADCHNFHWEHLSNNIFVMYLGNKYEHLIVDMDLDNPLDRYVASSKE